MGKNKAKEPGVTPESVEELKEAPESVEEVKETPESVEESKEAPVAEKSDENAEDAVENAMKPTVATESKDDRVSIIVMAPQDAQEDGFKVIANGAEHWIPYDKEVKVPVIVKNVIALSNEAKKVQKANQRAFQHIDD